MNLNRSLCNIRVLSRTNRRQETSVLRFTGCIRIDYGVRTWHEVNIDNSGVFRWSHAAWHAIDERNPWSPL